MAREEPLEAHVKENEREFNRIAQTFGELKTFVTGQFAAIDKRFDAIDKRFAEMDKRFDRLDDQIALIVKAVVRQ
jgi:archaellum component FlaC